MDLGDSRRTSSWFWRTLAPRTLFICTKHAEVRCYESWPWGILQTQREHPLPCSTSGILAGVGSPNTDQASASFPKSPPRVAMSWEIPRAWGDGWDEWRQRAALCPLMMLPYREYCSETGQGEGRSPGFHSNLTRSRSRSYLQQAINRRNSSHCHLTC